MAGVVIVSVIDSHARPGSAGVAVGYSGLYADIREGAVVVVAVELVGLGVVGYQQIEPGVVVVIHQRYAQGLAGRIEETCSLGSVFESAISPVVVQPRALAFVNLGGAVGFVFCVEGAELIFRDRPVHVVSDKEVEFAVVVVIEPYSAAGEASAHEFCVGGHV